MMKKVFLWGVVLFAAFAFMGCDTDGPEEKEKDTQLTLTVSGIPTDISIIAAVLYADIPQDENAIPNAVALDISGAGAFSFFEPAETSGIPLPSDKVFTATGSYYLILVDINIQEAATGDLTSLQQYPYKGFTAKFAFTSADATVAWGDFTGEENSGLTLTISDFPANTGILAGVLFGDQTMTTRSAVALNSNGTFAFYAFTADGSAPDFNTPFTTLGSYYILLSTTATGSGTNYIYSGGQSAYEFTSATGTVNWNSFVAVP